MKALTDLLLSMFPNKAGLRTFARYRWPDTVARIDWSGARDVVFDRVAVQLRVEGRVAATMTELAETYPDHGDDIAETRRALLNAGETPGAPRGRFTLKHPPSDFVVRVEAAAKLRGDIVGGVTIHGVHGAGGVGKTVLARHIAAGLAVDHPDARIEVDLQATKVPLTPAEAMARVVHAFDPDAQLPADVDALTAVYHQTLAGQRALLFFDDAASAEQVGPLVPPAPCVMVVTSRQRVVLPGSRPLDLGRMSPAEGCALLLNLAPRLTPEEAEAVCGRCGCNALALRVVGSWLAERSDFAVSDALRPLRDWPQRSDFDVVRASLELSLAGLAPAAIERWSMLGVFAGSFDRRGLMAVWSEPDEDAALDRIGALVGRGLVEVESAGGVSRHRLHDRVRDFARERLGEQAAETFRRHAQHYGQRLAEMEDDHLKGHDAALGAFASFDVERSNIESGWRWSVGRLEEDEGAMRLACDYPDAGACILGLRQSPAEQVTWLEPALSAARGLGDRDAEGVHLGSLGSAQRALGDLTRATDCFEEGLVISRELGDRPNEAVYLGNLAEVHGDRGDLDRAIACFEKAVAIDRELGDRRREGTDLANLANACFEQGDIPRALKRFERALVIHRETGDRDGQAQVHFALALLHRSVGHRDWARSHAADAWRIRESLGSPLTDLTRRLLASL